MPVYPRWSNLTFGTEAMCQPVPPIGLQNVVTMGYAQLLIQSLVWYMRTPVLHRYTMYIYIYRNIHTQSWVHFFDGLSKRQGPGYDTPHWGDHVAKGLAAKNQELSWNGNAQRRLPGPWALSGSVTFIHLQYVYPNKYMNLYIYIYTY